MNYDTGLFIDIVESIAGIQFLTQDENYGVIVRFYIGLKGNTVMIDVTDEDMDDDSAKGNLISLGLDHLIDALFRQVPAEEEEEENPFEKMRSENSEGC